MKVAIQGRAQDSQKARYKAAGIEVVEGTCQNEDEMIKLIGDADGAQAVSYTHLTLPTICSV